MGSMPTAALPKRICLQQQAISSGKHQFPVCPIELDLQICMCATTTMAQPRPQLEDMALNQKPGPW